MTSALQNAQIANEAADWAVRLDRGPLDAGERKALADWLRTSPVHVSELLESCAMIAALGSAAAADARSVDAILAEVAPEVVPLFGARRTIAGNEAGGVQANEPGRVRWPAGRRTLAVAASLAAVVAIAVTVMVMRPASPTNVSGSSGQIVAPQVTAIGEQRSLALDDGSVVSMNADSRLQVAFTRDSRRIDLVRGEALFDVAHEEGRPFRVYAAGLLVQAVGTEFIVKHTQDGIRVVVLEGRVLLNASADAASGDTAAGDGGSSRVLFLDAGRQITLLGDGTFSPIADANPSAATSWRARQLSFDNDTLATIAAEFNRYNRQRIEVRGAELAATRFSGVFDADDPESLLAYLEVSSAIRVTRPEPGKVILEPMESPQR